MTLIAAMHSVYVLVCVFTVRHTVCDVLLGKEEINDWGNKKEPNIEKEKKMKRGVHTQRSKTELGDYFRAQPERKYMNRM